MAVKENPVALPGQQPAEQTADAAHSQEMIFPEGGRDAWLALVGAWAVMFVTFGYMNAFGYVCAMLKSLGTLAFIRRAGLTETRVYQSIYQNSILRDQTESNIAWIGSLQIFFQFSSSIISGPLVDTLGPRVIIGPSAFALVLAQMLTSLCDKYWHFVLCQGVYGGLATGFLYSPAAAIVGHYFHKKRPMAMGIITSGSALGAILYPIILDQMLHHQNIGFGWTQRTIGL